VGLHQICFATIVAAHTMNRSAMTMDGKPDAASRADAGTYMPALDGVRALAVTAVLLHHCFHRLFPGGGLGVDLFFVLSGFLITRLLDAEVSSSGTLRIDLFYVRRALRLLPPVFFVLLLSFFIFRFKPPNVSVAWFDAPTTWSWPRCASAVLLYYANYTNSHLGILNPTWSLSIEEHFYFVWPVLLWFLRSKAKATSARWQFIVPLLLIAGCVIERIALYHAHFSSFPIAALTPSRIDSLLLGAIAGFAAKYKSVTLAVRKLYARRLPELLTVLLLVMVLLMDSYGRWLVLGGYTLVAMVFALYVLCMSIDQDSVLYRCFKSSLPVWVGKRSYGIYLYQLPTFAALDFSGLSKGLNPYMTIFLLKIPLTLLLAEFSYRFVEMPFFRLKRSFHVKR
jgi:peptidoglycan/LPS O-acetylase OafA/YrhL